MFEFTSPLFILLEKFKWSNTEHPTHCVELKGAQEEKDRGKETETRSDRDSQTDRQMTDRHTHMHSSNAPPRFRSPENLQDPIAGWSREVSNHSEDRRGPRVMG